jgi:glutamyl-tRNA reductase
MQFQQALRALDIGPAVGALKEKLRRIAREEFERQRGRLGPLTPEQEQAIEQMLMSAVNKISHPVIHRMRRSYDAGEETEVQAWRESFGLEEEEEERKP